MIYKVKIALRVRRIKSHEGAHHRGYGFLRVAFYRFIKQQKGIETMVHINGEDVNAAGMTLGAYLEENGYKPLQIAVEINMVILPKDQYDTTVLKEGDVVEIVSFVGGGSR